PNGNQPSLLNTSYTITADIDVPQAGAEGVIVGEGDRFVGYALYLLKGKPVFTYNFFDLQRTRWEGGDELAPGKHAIVYDFKYDGLGGQTLAYNDLGGVGRGGTGTLQVDGKVVSTQKLEHTVPLALPLDQTFNIGNSGSTPVDDNDYKVPFPFSGKINKVTITLEPPVLTPAAGRSWKKHTAPRRMRSKVWTRTRSHSKGPPRRVLADRSLRRAGSHRVGAPCRQNGQCTSGSCSGAPPCQAPSVK